MKPTSPDSETKVVLCLSGAAILPFAITSLYLLVGRTSESYGALRDFYDLLFFFLSIMAGLICVAGLPIQLLGRIAIACVYVPLLCCALNIYSLYFVILFCGETL